VPFDEVVKGYEVEPGRYVTLTDDELERVAPEQTRAIEIEQFVELDELDPMLLESSYYLVPDKGAVKAYELLRSAMGDASKIGIGRVVLRTKQYLAAIRVEGPALTLSTLAFADEVLPQDDVPGLEAVEAPARDELRAAGALVDSLAAPFRAEDFHDEYRERVLALIRSKEAGEVVEPEPEEPSAPKVTDLMAALEASLAQARGKGGDGAGEDDGDGERPRARARGAAKAKAPARKRARKGDDG
jgi:DNA end-binding protein Ku